MAGHAKVWAARADMLEGLDWGAPVRARTGRAPLPTGTE